MEFHEMSNNYENIRAEFPQVKIVSVTKNHSWSECEFLYRSGARDFGENRIQKALPKMDEAPKDIAWHFIGNIQSNKVNKIGRRFKLIHSVDSYEIAKKISEFSSQKQAILLQVNISHKHGFTPETLAQEFGQLKELPNLDIQGLMAMAPQTTEAGIRETFRTLRNLRDSLNLNELSMGMSDDWRIAIEEGATIIRLGNYLFNE